jgi:Topoisomerase DNA binding C4 zinc finger
MAAKQSPIEDAIELASLLPWWVGASGSGISYFVLHRYASAAQDLSKVPTDKMLSTSISHTFLLAAQWLAPFVFALGALTSLVGKMRRRRNSAQLSGTGNAEGIQQTAPANPTAHLHGRTCPSCSNSMTIRTARSGPTPGSQFWGCNSYPKCRATCPL